jgi:hypothetical protein
MEEVTLAEEAAVGSLISLGTVISCLSASEKYAMELGLLCFMLTGKIKRSKYAGAALWSLSSFPDVRSIGSYRCDSTCIAPNYNNYIGCRHLNNVPQQPRPPRKSLPMSVGQYNVGAGQAPTKKKC